MKPELSQAEIERIAKLKRELWSRISVKTTWGRNELVNIIKYSLVEVYGEQEDPLPF